MKNYNELLFNTEGVVKKWIKNYSEDLYENIKEGKHFDGDKWTPTQKDKIELESLYTDLSRMLIADGENCETNFARIDVGRLSGIIMGYWYMNISYGDLTLVNKKVFDKIATAIIINLYK